jgi:hypothetical protein
VQKCPAADDVRIHMKHTGESHMNRDKKKMSPVKPFFTRFLEQQDLENVTGGVNEGKQTLKYPSDSEDSGT